MGYLNQIRGSDESVAALEGHNMALNKTELVAKIAAETGQSQAAVSSVIDGLFAAVSETVAGGDKVSIPGWISFETATTAARTGRNPRTGDTIKIKAAKVPKFRPGKALKDAVN